MLNTDVWKLQNKIVYKTSILSPGVYFASIMITTRAFILDKPFNSFLKELSQNEKRKNQFFVDSTQAVYCN